MTWNLWFVPKEPPQEVTPPSVLTLFLRAHTTPLKHSTGVPEEERETSGTALPGVLGANPKFPDKESTSLIRTF